MKALKIMDLMVVGLFVVGIVVGITQYFNHEFVPENNVAEVISQQIDTIDPAS